MKFVIFILLFAGVSFAFPQSGDNESSDSPGTVGGLLGLIPALLMAPESQKNVIGNVSELTEVINAADDASAVLYGLAEGFGNAIDVFEALAGSNAGIAEAISNVTNVSGLSFDFFELGGVIAALNVDSKAAAGIAATFSGIIDSLRTASSSCAPSSFTEDISNAADALEDVYEGKSQLIESIKKLKGLSGAAFGLVSFVSGITSGLNEESQAVADLSAAISNKVAGLNDPDLENEFGILTGALDDYSTATGGIAAAIRGSISV